MKLTRTHALVGLAALGMFAVSAVSEAADPMTSATGGSLPSADRTFVQKAAIGGMTEIAASEVAEQKATSPAAKEFASRMITDHKKAGEELTKIAADKGVTTPGTLDPSHKSEVDKLSKKSGSDFDKAYLKQMVSDHKTVVSLFEKEAKSGKDPDLQAFASKTLPTLQDHLKMAQTFEEGLK